ncbi:hypothetical protein KKC22_05430 [Myxococcota bacterium]|nr:hypothetical protein [Myxococcota bacterium]
MALALFAIGCDDATPKQETCGNGLLDPGEACDGTEIPAEGCLALGYYEQNGDLACNADCTLDLTVCEGRCGDGVISTQFGEDCEGEDVGGETCTTLGLGTGTLACMPNCSFDTTGCEIGAVCGDGTITTPTEQCEGDDVGGQTCETLGYYGGALTCDTDCTFELLSCATFGRCGDAQVQAAYGEDCEGANLNGGTCETLGYYGGTLLCDTDCGFDLTGCASEGLCGDDAIQDNQGEICDGTALNGLTCEDLGYHGGALGCMADCGSFDITDCVNEGRCGDDAIQDGYGEVCDGAALSGQTCELLGFYGGTLACDAGCETFDTSDCATFGRCGDGMVQGAYGEECDGTELNGATCGDFGFYQGSVTCGSDCRYVISDCSESCGDADIQTTFGEVCDGMNLASQSCLTLGYYGGTLECMADCGTFDITDCANVGRCGDGTLQGGFGEVCDGTALNSQTCVTRGYYGGSLACNANCQAFDETACAAVGKCGDASVQTAYAEVCDGLNLDAQTCVTRGYYGGSLTCNADCRTFDESVCAAVGKCGDNILQPGYGEVCDGTALNSQTCVTRGYYGGELACNSNCLGFNEAPCITVGKCGDGSVQTAYGEECDGGNLNGQSCQTQDFYTGILACDTNCHFVLSGCSEYCGDSTVQTAFEDCDGSDLNAQSCLTQGYYGGELSCSATCDFYLASCEAAGFCGDGEVQPTHEDCDGMELEGETCRTLGHFTGTLGCDATCGFDESGCRAVVQVAAGYQHACALLDDGTVRCWGYNYRGQVGPAADLFQCTPVVVTGLSGVVAIAAGQNHTCAVLSDGTAKCWGLNSNGQLGNGSYTDSSVPVGVITLGDAVAMAAGSSHTCALRATGGVVCWGLNTDGQLGNGNNVNQIAPVAVTGLVGATDISTGAKHTCARLGTGVVQCWGYNLYGQLGDGTMTSRNLPVSVSGILTAAGLSTGSSHACAVLTDQTVRCWGRNNYGQLGDGTLTSRSTPVVVAGLTNVTHVGAGVEHTCARQAGSALRCWGRNETGALGDGTTTDRPTSVAVSGMTNAVDISAGQGFSCATLSDGNLRCWGANESCELGIGDKLSLIPVAVDGLTGIDLLSSGFGLSCTVQSDDTVRCWGRNASGQLGNGTLDSSYLPVTPSLTGASHVNVGGGHSCAVLLDGYMKCWGSNTSYQLGTGNNTPSSIPVNVVGITNAVSVAPGNNHTCALLDDATVRCWGAGSDGQNGNGTWNLAVSPVVVVGLSGVERIVSGMYYTCALLADGTVRCWGRNSYGQLGNGTTSNANAPVSPTGLTGAISIAVSNSHTCVALASGGMKCWGYNLYGKLGDGTQTSRTTPVSVLGVNGVIDVAVGYYHTCALSGDGSVRCWGGNERGQLGDGTITNRLSPGLVPGITASSLEAGTDFTCVRTAGGTAYCWGDNYDGQLGVSNDPYSSTPVPVHP